MALGWLRRERLPDALTACLERDERIQAAARCIDGTMLAASRFGLWVVRDGEATRRPWHLVSKARFAAHELTVVGADAVGELADGTVVLVDRPTETFVLSGRSGLTDVVHARVRRSVAASRHLSWPNAGGWVVLRRVAGRDGVIQQVRLDPRADSAAPGFADAVGRVVAELVREQPQPT